MKIRYYCICLALVLVAAAAFAYVLPGLPDQVPVHWNARGAADRYGSPWTLFAIGPGLMAVTLVVFASMPWLSPKRFEVDSSLRTYLALMLICVAMMGYFYAITLWAALKGPGLAGQAMAGGVCLLAVLIGNLLGKVRRNFFIGIRTPWTLASERVWYATHRFAGKLTVSFGLVGLALIFVGVPTWVTLIVVTAGFLIPALHSLLYYKKLEKQGELDVVA